METELFGKRYQGLDWSDFRTDVAPNAEAIRDVCRDYAEGFATALENGENGVLVGGPGTGKTMLTALICGTVQRDGHSVWRISAPRFYGLEQPAARTADLLIIDDIEPERWTPLERDSFFDILYRRYHDCLPTVLVTDAQGAESLSEDPRFVRFDDMCVFWLKLDWPSYRRRACNGGQCGHETLRGREMPERPRPLRAVHC